MKRYGSFWAKTKKVENCLIWTGGILAHRKHGKLVYGKTKLFGKVVLAHRVAWILHSGDFIPRGRQVLHKCDTPLCVKPSHLYLGSNEDNVKDRWDKTRWKI